MIDIDFTYIKNYPQDEQALLELVQQFGKLHDVNVHLRQMSWSTAWADLFSIASHHKGADVSHIGGTWVSSLAKMNALRAFKPSELSEIGTPQPFMMPTWESTKVLDDEHIWAIPWTGWIYAVCYRKDLLGQVGIDISKAFGTTRRLRETITTLRDSALDIAWLNPRVPAPYTDLLHVAASWVWAAGADFIDDGGVKVVFDTPQAIDGLVDWLDTYRGVKSEHRDFTQAECYKLFIEGRAAAYLSDVHNVNEIIDGETAPIVRENLGVATLTDVPWSGGGNFVIWDHTRGHFERERAAVDLVKFLTNKQSNLNWRAAGGHMPARIDALEEAYPAGNPLHDAIMLAARKGRAYHNVPLWRRIEYQLSQELGAVVADANEQPSVDSASIVRLHMEPLAKRLNTTLGN